MIPLSSVAGSVDGACISSSTESHGVSPKIRGSPDRATVSNRDLLQDRRIWGELVVSPTVGI